MRQATLGASALLGLALAPGCEGEHEELATKHGSQPRSGGESDLPPSFHFVDATQASGLEAFHQENGGSAKTLLPETIGGGVAFLDYDRDGDLDVYLSNGARFVQGVLQEGPADALYVNQGDGRFVDGTAAAGLGDRRWTNGVTVVDYDGDAWPDIYLTNYGPNALYRNRGDGTFEECAERVGLAAPEWSTGAAFFDWDKDGDLDLYLASYVDFDPAEVLAAGKHEEYAGIQVLFGPRGLPGAPDRFYENTGDGRFLDRSEEVGIRGLALYGFQVVVCDFDRDGWPDLYVANDSQPNLLWRNVEGQRFEDVAFSKGLALSANGNPQASMGVALGDWDGDLAPDLYVTNFAEDYNTLYAGDTQGRFRDVTMRHNLRGLSLPLVGWGTGFADFDNDGDLDLYAVHGHVYPEVDELSLGTTYRQPPILLENDGSGTLRAPAGGAGPGFARNCAGRGSALGDYDGDGDLDILIGTLDGPPLLLRNDSPRTGHWVRIALVGGAANTSAIGARIEARVGERRALRFVGANTGFLSSDAPEVQLGLGSATRLDELVVHWPSGASESLRDLAADRLYRIAEGRGLLRED